MTKKDIDSNYIVSFGSISDEKDIIVKGKINLNSPPEDCRCYCCRNHISELTPFGKAGDPLVGDFDGELLVKTFRPMAPYDEKAEQAMNHVIKLMEKEGRRDDDLLYWLNTIYGEEYGEDIFYTVHSYSGVGSSWECRDCIVLDDDEYFEMLEKTYST